MGNARGVQMLKKLGIAYTLILIMSVNFLIIVFSIFFGLYLVDFNAFIFCISCNIALQIHALIGLGLGIFYSDKIRYYFNKLVE